MKTRHSPVILLAGLTLIAACRHRSSEELETSESVPVKTQAAEVGTIQALVWATGLIDPAPGADWTIIAPEAGRIAELPKAEGDSVRKGELLVRFEIPSLPAEAKSKEAALTQAQAHVDNASKEYTRLEGLLERGVASRKEVEDAQRELIGAQAAVGEARSARSAAATLAGQTVVRARFDGLVAKRWHNPGDRVDASNSDPVLRIVDPKRLQAVAQVAAADVPRIVPGHAATVTLPGADGGEDAQTGAKVAAEPGAVDPLTATASVRLILGGRTQLAPGTPVQVAIVAEEHRDVILVPAAAIVREEDESAVFVAGADGHAHRSVVTVGIVAGDKAEILFGLKASDAVVVRGQESLPDGAAITVAP